MHSVDQLDKRLRELWSQKKTLAEIAVILNKENYKTPRNKSIDVKFVNNRIYRLRKLAKERGGAALSIRRGADDSQAPTMNMNMTGMADPFLMLKNIIHSDIPDNILRSLLKQMFPK